MSFSLPDRSMSGLSYIAPIAYFVSVLAGIGSAVVLVATLRTSHQPRSTFLLALSFALNAVIMLVTMMVLPLLPNESPTFHSPPGTAIWLFVLWHVTTASGAAVYVFSRYRDASQLPTRSFFVVSSSAAAAVFVGICAIGFALGPVLPTLATGTSVRALTVTGVGPFCVIALAIASVLVWRLRESTPVERALAYSLCAISASMLIFFLGGHRYNGAFYIGRTLLLAADLFVMSAAIRTLIGSRLQLADTERALSDANHESARQAARIRALWEIASRVDVPDESYGAILKIATEAIRPDTPMFGLLSHLEEDRLVTDARSWTKLGAGIEKVVETIYPGVSVAFERTVQSLLREIQGSRAWNGLNDIGMNNLQFEQLGMQSVVGTSLQIGRRNYFLTFSSFAEIVPFAEDDIAFVDVVAAFFSSRFSQEQQYERIQFQIEHDALTGLINRVQFRKAVRAAVLKGEPFAVAFLDLDGFRHVNDHEGTQIADEVLVEVAAELRAVSTDDTVARMSADEFGLLIRSPDQSTSVEGVLVAYGEIFSTPFHTGDRFGTRMLGLSASIGAAAFPVDGDTPEELMRRADAALNMVKARGGAGVLLFNASMENVLAETHLRTVELAEAIAHDQLALVYQPTYDLATRTLIGAEALCRWDHPRRGRLPPSDFIPFAQQHLLMADLSRWVFRRTIADIASAKLPPKLRIYFNLAAESLEDLEFIAEIKAALSSDSRLEKHLGVEITETAAMRNIERCINTVDLLRSWGISVAIDDFGTGYSSLAYLKQLTVDVIKIDRSFVTGLPDDRGVAAIAQMLLNVSEHFGFSTLAEGVETEQQAAWLVANGCRFGQGFLFSHPLPFSEFIDGIRQL